MKPRRSYRIFAFVFLATLLISFVFALVIYFTQQQIATQKAIEACNPGYGLQPVGPPTETRAHLATDWGSLVWVVEMKGTWILVGGPPPALENQDHEPIYRDECTIMIDAITGDVKSTPIE